MYVLYRVTEKKNTPLLKPQYFSDRSMDHNNIMGDYKGDSSIYSCQISCICDILFKRHCSFCSKGMFFIFT